MDLSNFTILYVDNVQRSVDFYRPLCLAGSLSS